MDVTPCACWLAGQGVKRAEVLHPDEFDDGRAYVFEKTRDI